MSRSLDTLPASARGQRRLTFMDFVSEPIWDSVALHLGYAVMVLSTISIVLPVLERLIDRFGHFFDLPGVIRDAHRWRRHAKSRSPFRLFVDELKSQPPRHEPDAPSQSPQSPSAAEDPVRAPKAARHDRFKNIKGVPITFSVPGHVYEALRIECRRLHKDSVENVALGMVERFVADLYDDPEQVSLPCRQKATVQASGVRITLTIGDGDERLLGHFRQDIDWPVLLDAEFFAEIVKAKLSQLKAARRLASDSVCLEALGIMSPAARTQAERLAQRADALSKDRDAWRASAAAAAAEAKSERDRRHGAVAEIWRLAVPDSPPSSSDEREALQALTARIVRLEDAATRRV